MENKIYYVNGHQISEIQKDLYTTEGLWVGEIDGAQVDTWEDYLNTISELMQFPTISKSLISYSDWISDLSWLNATGYALIIQNFDRFMSKDLKSKTIVMESFEEDILPWWQEEIKNCVVEGEPKSFNVYLVD